MGAPFAAPAGQLPRKDQALAFIVERTVRYRASPSFREIARELGVSVTRARQLVDQLIEDGRIAKRTGAQRGLAVVDLTETRTMLDEALRRLGWITADPLGNLQAFPQEQLPRLPELQYLRDLD